MAVLIFIVVFASIIVVIWGVTQADNAQQVAVALGSGVVFGLVVSVMVLLMPSEVWGTGGMPSIRITTPSPSQVLSAFEARGLTVKNISTSGALTPQLQNSAPSCTVYRFEVGVQDYGGRVASCGSTRDAETVEQYYVSIGQGVAFLFSHTYRRGSLVLVMNGTVDKALFDRYVAALP